MEFEILLGEISAIMRCESSKNRLYIDYYSKSGEYLLRDKFSIFTSFEFDSKNPLHCFFRGESIERSVYFGCDSDLSDFLEVIRNFCVYSVDSGSVKGITFTHKSKDEQFIPKVTNSISGFLGKAYSNVKSKVVDRIPSGKMKYEDTNIIEKEFTRDFSLVDCSDINSDCISFSSSRLSKEQYMQILTQDCNFTVSDYLNIKNQWTLVFEEQWNHFASFRKYVYDLENHLLKSSFFSPTTNNIVFCVLMNVSSYFFHKITYNPCFLSITILFFEAIANPANHDDFLNTPILSDQPHDQVSTLVFYSVISFLKKFVIQKNPDYIYPTDEIIFSKSLSLISNNSASTYDFLMRIGLKSFKGMNIGIQSLFIENRASEDSMHLLSALIRSRDPEKFIVSSIASSIILIVGRIASNENNKDLNLVFNKLLSTIDYRLWLFNIEKLIRINNM